MEHTEKVGKLWRPELMESLSEKLGQNVEDIVYKRVFGEEETVAINGKNYTLIPTGNINYSIQGLKDGTTSLNRGNNSESGVLRILTSNLTPIRINDANIDYVKSSYIGHYRDTLGEAWSDKDFDDRLNSLSYVTYKYVKDEATGEVFIAGFFGVQVATGAGGKYLTNGELYVLPEFRGRGIAKELVHQSLGLAFDDGIKNFDSLTYTAPGFDALGFWKNIGAENTELYHISGDVSTIIDNTMKK